MRIPVMESATGNIVSGLQAPTPETLEAFLAANPGWEVLPEEESDSSDEEESEGHKHGESEEKKQEEEEEEKESKYQGLDLWKFMVIIGILSLSL